MLFVLTSIIKDTFLKSGDIFPPNNLLEKQYVAWLSDGEELIFCYEILFIILTRPECVDAWFNQLSILINRNLQKIHPFRSCVFRLRFQFEFSLVAFNFQGKRIPFNVLNSQDTNRSHDANNKHHNMSYSGCFKNADIVFLFVVTATLQEAMPRLMHPLSFFLDSSL